MSPKTFLVGAVKAYSDGVVLGVKRLRPVEIRFGFWANAEKAAIARIAAARNVTRRTILERFHNLDVTRFKIFVEPIHHVAVPKLGVLRF